MSGVEVREYGEVYKPCHLDLPPGLSYEEWQTHGENLAAMSGSIQWWIGDFINYGEAAYGEKYSQALTLWESQAKDEGYGGLANMAWVSREYESSIRIENLSWSHHLIAASLNEDQRQVLLERAATEGWSAHDLRRQVRTLKTPTIGPAKGQYAVVYADPPWRYEHSKTHSRDVENQYPTMELEDICAVSMPAAPDCVLYLWATAPKLTEAIQVMEAWGFTYRTNAVWDKQIIGMGYWWRGQHELLLVGVRGNPSPPPEDKRLSSLFSFKRGKHSEKPPQVYGMIESMYPNADYIELFQRTPRKGWKGWGDEVGEAA